MFGRAKVGDGSIYDGVWTTYSGRIVGPDDPLAKGPTDVSPSTRGDAFYARKFGGPHTGIVMFALCDGSVRSIRTSIDTANLRRLAMRAGQSVTSTGGGSKRKSRHSGGKNVGGRP